MEKKPATVKQINPKAPRFGKADFTYQVVRRELWEQWKADTGNDLPYNEFMSIWESIATEIRKQTIENVQGVRLPFFNGDLSLKFVKTREKHIDGLTSAREGIVVRHLDWHSDKRPGKVCWVIKHAMVRNRWVQLYGFDPCRKLETMATEAFFENPGMYQVARATDFNKKQL